MKRNKQRVTFLVTNFSELVRSFRQAYCGVAVAGLAMFSHRLNSVTNKFYVCRFFQFIISNPQTRAAFGINKFFCSEKWPDKFCRCRMIFANRLFFFWR